MSAAGPAESSPPSVPRVVPRSVSIPVLQRWPRPPGGEHRSGQTLVRVAQPEQATQHLLARGVQVTRKPEGVRISTHFYNDESEIDACVAALVEHREQILL